MASSPDASPEDTGLPVDDLAALRETVASLTPGEDAVIVECTARRTLPLAVDAEPDRHGWDCVFGDDCDWPACVTVQLAGEHAGDHVLVVDDLSTPPRLTFADVAPDGRDSTYDVHDVTAVPDVDEWWCGKCGHGPTTARGIRVHDSRNDDHDGDPVVCHREPDDVLDEDATEIETGDDIPPAQQAWILEWGRNGPPLGGTYHVDADCWTLDRSDSDRDAVPLPRPLDDLEADEDWTACGHCSDDTADDDEVDPDAEDLVGDDDAELECESEPVQDDGDELVDPEGAGDDDMDDGPREDSQEHNDAHEESDSADEESNYDETGTGRYPCECRCGVVCEDSLDWAIHRLEVHGVSQSRLDYLDPGEFESLVEAADTVRDLADDLDWSLRRTLRVLSAYGLGDVVGPSDVELSAVTDVDLPPVATDNQSTTEDEPATQDAGGDAQPADYSGGDRTPHVEFVDASNLDDRPTEGDRERLAALEFDVPVEAEAIFEAVNHSETRSIHDVARRLDWGSKPRQIGGRVRKILFQLDLYDELPEPEGHRSPEANGGRPA
jgi:hypothetical protein